MITIDLGANAAVLEGITWAVYPREFSGIATVKVSPDFNPYKNTGIVTLDNFWLHDVGSYGHTQFTLNPKIVPVRYWPHIKCWVHRHPLGDAHPGWHNWSQEDNDNIKFDPLGSDPKLVKWSVSIVRTPYLWVGRVDTYEPHKTIHCPVFPRIDFSLYEAADRLFELAVQQEKEPAKKQAKQQPKQPAFVTNDLYEEDSIIDENLFDVEMEREWEEQRAAHLQEVLWPEDEWK
jgi:hypothetical protein